MLLKLGVIIARIEILLLIIKFNNNFWKCSIIKNSLLSIRALDLLKDSWIEG